MSYPNNTPRNPGNLVTQTLSNDSIIRHSRQIILPQVTPQGQKKLENSRVLIVGAGGLGCPAALYLAAAGVGYIGIVDGDRVELSNLHRQVLHTTANVGKLKALSAVEKLTDLNPRVNYRAFPERLTNKNALEIVEQFDLVVDATDNPPTRYILNDACVLTGRPLVVASALRFDGQLAVYNLDATSPCYRCMFPQAPKPDAVGRCAEQGVVGAVCGVVGALQALEAIKVLLTRPANHNHNHNSSSVVASSEQASNESAQQTGNADAAVLNGRMFVFDGLRDEFRVVQLRKRRDDCEVCSTDVKIRTVTRQSFAFIDYVAFCNGVPLCDAPIPVVLRLVESEHRIAPDKYLRDFVLPARPHLLLDVRPRLEADIFRLSNAVSFPLGDFNDAAAVERLKTLVADSAAAAAAAVAAAKGAAEAEAADPQSKPELAVVTVCRRGNTSQRALLKLRELLQNQPAAFEHLPARVTPMDVEGGYCELAKVKASQISVNSSSSSNASSSGNPDSDDNEAFLDLPMYF